MHRSYLAGVAVAAALVLAACTEAVTGSGQPGSNGPATHASSAAASAPSGGFPTDPRSLAALLAQGGRALKSAHIEVAETELSTEIRDSGDERLSAGKVQSIDLSESVNSTKVRFIVIDATVFAHLPKQVYPATKPWVEITATTSGAQLQQLYSAFQIVRKSGASDTARYFVAAGKDLQLRGNETLDSVPVGHYELTVDTASLPSDFPNRAALVQAGPITISVELWVDAQGHTRQVVENFLVSSHPVFVKTTLTKIDEPVTITAPPASQVETP